MVQEDVKFGPAASLVSKTVQIWRVKVILALPLMKTTLLIILRGKRVSFITGN